MDAESGSLRDSPRGGLRSPSALVFYRVYKKRIN